MPSPTRRCAGSASKSMRPSSALPVAGTAPINARNRVVLPAPLRPMRPHISPSGRSIATLRTIWICPIETPRSTTLSISDAPAQAGAGSADQGLNLWIGERDRRRPVRNDSAIVEGEHAVGKAGYDLHVLFDEQDGDLSAPQRRHHHIHDCKFLLDGNAAGLLIEQKQAGRAAYRHRNVEQLARPLRQHRGRGVAVLRASKQLNDSVDVRDYLGRAERTQRQWQNAVLAAPDGCCNT